MNSDPAPAGREGGTASEFDDGFVGAMDEPPNTAVI
jgi:hypothetical protein